jgi:hypothetical protein
MSGYWIVAPPVPLSEPVPVQEFIVHGPGGIWYDNGNLMVPCYHEETLLEDPWSQPQRVVKVKLWTPHHQMAEVVGFLAHALWPSPPLQPGLPPTVRGSPVHVVKK